MAQGDQTVGSSTSQVVPDGRQPDHHLARADLAQDQTSLAVENLRLQEALRRAEGATEEFIDFVAHELKQPMTALKGYSQMLIMGIAGELTPMQRQFVDVIDANAERMSKLVNDLLEVSRLEAGRIQLRLAPLGLMQILDEALAGTRAEIEARHHTLEVDVPADLPPVLGDRERLIQILAHLVRNACRYTPEGGRLRLEAGEQTGRVCVRVVDSGIGLSPEEMLRLGEKFFRADHELVQQQPGSGLGLSIIRQLVALHGGELRVESEPGRGSTFAFTLPRAGGDEATPAGP
jgi:two-component system phosphate regulon sensor histidine kinase PhoR